MAAPLKRDVGSPGAPAASVSAVSWPLRLNGRGCSQVSYIQSLHSVMIPLWFLQASEFAISDFLGAEVTFVSSTKLSLVRTYKGTQFILFLTIQNEGFGRQSESILVFRVLQCF